MDRRVRKTRQALREALFSLVLERGWDRVSVQDVCQRADVGRSTFYTHFADREDLLLSGFEELKVALRAARPGPLGFVRGLVEHVDENRKLARLFSDRRGPPIRRRLTGLVVALIEEDLATLTPRPPGGADPLRAATARFLAGALVDLLMWRLEGGTPLDRDLLVGLFERLAAPIVRDFREQSPSDAA